MTIIKIERCTNEQ